MAQPEKRKRQAVHVAVAPKKRVAPKSTGKVLSGQTHGLTPRNEKVTRAAVESDALTGPVTSSPNVGVVRT